MIKWIIGFLLVYCVYFAYSHCSSVVPECKSGSIVSVGGCNKYGTCSYRTDNGMVGETRMPVEGQWIQSCSSSVRCE